jgi:hypothetical protein
MCEAIDRPARQRDRLLAILCAEKAATNHSVSESINPQKCKKFRPNLQ